MGEDGIRRRHVGAVLDVLSQEDFDVRHRATRGVDARLMDGQRLSFDSEFDAVFSNAALHWMRDADAVLAGVKRALKPGGRFVAEMGGHGNIASIVVALTAVLARRGIAAGPLNPFYFPTAEAYRAKLERAGFATQEIRILPRPTVLTSDIESWLDAFCEAFLGAVPEPDRVAARTETVELLQPVLQAEDGRWILDYVRLRFRASLPASS